MGIEALGEDVFLSLLTTQLQFQDPLDPMDSVEFVAQLAQFQELETAMATSETLNTLVTEATMANNLSVAGLLGKTVEVLGGFLSHEVDEIETISYNLTADASEVIIHVVDEEGLVVRTMTINESQTAGAHQVIWDGKDDEGNAAPAGNYTYIGAANDGSGLLVPIELYSTGEVTGVSYETGGPFITVNGINVPVGDILKILQ